VLERGACPGAVGRRGDDHDGAARRSASPQGEHLAAGGLLVESENLPFAPVSGGLDDEGLGAVARVTPIDDTRGHEPARSDAGGNRQRVPEPQPPSRIELRRRIHTGAQGDDGVDRQGWKLVPADVDRSDECREERPEQAEDQEGSSEADAYHVAGVFGLDMRLELADVQALNIPGITPDNACRVLD
jgi:hypothetical protein